MSPFGEGNTPLGQADDRILNGFKRIYYNCEAALKQTMKCVVRDLFYNGNYIDSTSGDWLTRCLMGRRWR